MSIAAKPGRLTRRMDTKTHRLVLYRGAASTEPHGPSTQSVMDPGLVFCSSLSVVEEKTYITEVSEQRRALGTVKPRFERLYSLFEGTLKSFTSFLSYVTAVVRPSPWWVEHCYSTAEGGAP